MLTSRQGVLDAAALQRLELNALGLLETAGPLSATIDVAVDEDEPVELVDEEGTPRATGRIRAPSDGYVVVDDVTVNSVPERFDHVHLRPTGPADSPLGPAVVTTRALHRDDLDVLAGIGGPVLVVAAETPAVVGTPEWAGVVAALEAGVRMLADGSRLVVAPWPFDNDGTAEVITRLGGTDLLRLDDTGADDEVRSLIAAGRSVPEVLSPVEVVAELAAGAREPGLVVLFTGLSGSGKSTIARAVAAKLVERRRRPTTLLDGDVVRRHLSRGLGFSREDRETNVARIGFVAAEIARHGGMVVCAPIAPYDHTRQAVRAMVEQAGAQFVLVHVATPLEVCEQRDVKGLYARARAGELSGFTGIDDPYETPTDADVVLDTSTMPIDDAAAQVLATCRETR